MALSNILLKIAGDGDDAKRELAAVARDVAQLAGEEAEATVKVNAEQAHRETDRVKRELADVGRLSPQARVSVRTDAASAQLARLNERLKRLSEQEATPRVKLAMARVIEQIDRVELKLKRLDAERVEIKVKLDRSAVDQLGGLQGVVAKLRRSMSEAVQAGGGFGGILGRLRGGAAGLVPPIGLLAVSLAGPLLSALGGLVASAGAAVAGMGALGIAAGGALIPILALGLGAVSQYHKIAKAQKQVTAAQHALKVAEATGSATAVKHARQRLALAQQELRATGNFSQALQQLKRTAQATVGPGVRQVFHGIADSIRTVIPTLRSLRPAFTGLGRAAGDMFRTLARAFASPELKTGFAALTRGAGQLIRAATPGLVGIVRILTNIARAAMPFLIAATGRASAALQRLGDGTSNIARLRGIIATLIGHLRSWLALAGALGRVMLAFFKAAAPAGKGLVDSLASGARHLAEWLSSSRGVETVRRFMADTLPIVRQLVSSIGQFAVLLLRVSQVASPVVHVVLGLASALLAIVNKVPGLRAVVAGIVGLSAAARIGGVVAGVFSGAWTALKFILGAARVQMLATAAAMYVERAAMVASTVASTAAGVAMSVVRAGLVALRAVLLAMRLAWALAFGPVGLIVAAVVAAVALIVTHWKQVKAALTAIWHAIAAAARAVWNGIKVAVTAYVRTVVAVVKALWNGLKAAVVATWHAIRAAALAVWHAITAVVSAATRAVSSAVRSVWSGVRGFLTGLWNGIRSAASSAWNAIKSAISAATHAVGSVVRSVWNGVRGALTAIWGAIRGAASSAWNAIKSVVVGAVRGALSAISGLAGSFVGVGRSIIMGLVNGIKSVAGAVVDAAKSVVHGAIQGAKSLLGIHSPSRVFAEIGEHTSEGLAVGIRRGAGSALRAARDELAAPLALGFQAALAVSAPPSVRPALPVRQAAAGDTYGDVNVTVPQPVPAGYTPDPKHLSALLGETLRARGGRR